MHTQKMRAPRVRHGNAALLPDEFEVSPPLLLLTIDQKRQPPTRQRHRVWCRHSAVTLCFSMYLDVPGCSSLFFQLTCDSENLMAKVAVSLG